MKHFKKHGCHYLWPLVQEHQANDQMEVGKVLRGGFEPRRTSLQRLCARRTRTPCTQPLGYTDT